MRNFADNVPLGRNEKIGLLFTTGIRNYQGYHRPKLFATKADENVSESVGYARSSVESSVMGEERRGIVIWFEYLKTPNESWKDGQRKNKVF